MHRCCVSVCSTAALYQPSRCSIHFNCMWLYTMYIVHAIAIYELPSVLYCVLVVSQWIRMIFQFPLLFFFLFPFLISPFSDFHSKRSSYLYCVVVGRLHNISNIIYHRRSWPWEKVSDWVWVGIGRKQNNSIAQAPSIECASNVGGEWVRAFSPLHKQSSRCVCVDSSSRGCAACSWFLVPPTSKQSHGFISFCQTVDRVERSFLLSTYLRHTMCSD